MRVCMTVGLCGCVYDSGAETSVPQEKIKRPKVNMWRLGFEPCTPGWNSKTTTTTLLLLLLQEAVAGPLDLTIGRGWLVLLAAEENGAAASEHDGDHRSRGSPVGLQNSKAGPMCACGAAVEGTC